MAQTLYCEQTDLTVPQKALGGVSSDTITHAISNASSVADGYLRRRYDLPLRAYTQSLNQAVADIATYFIMRDRGFTPNSANTEQIVGGYRDALAWLEKVAANKVDPAFVDANGEGQDETVAAPQRTEKPFTYYRTQATTLGDVGSFWDGRKRGW